MKKLSLFIAIVFIITAIFSANVFAVSVGDKLGNVLYTDIKAYINGERIPCYNVDGNIAVMVSDLNNYGFDTSWNAKERTTTIKLNTGKKFTPLKVEDSNKEVGSVAFPYVYTDIRAIVNGSKVDSYNIQGNLCIAMKSLSPYGNYVWDGKTRTVSLTISAKIDEWFSYITWFDGKIVQLTAKKEVTIKGVSVFAEGKEYKATSISNISGNMGSKNGAIFRAGSQLSFSNPMIIHEGTVVNCEVNTSGAKPDKICIYFDDGTELSTVDFGVISVKK